MGRTKCKDEVEGRKKEKPRDTFGTRTVIENVQSIWRNKEEGGGRENKKLGWREMTTIRFISGLRETL